MWYKMILEIIPYCPLNVPRFADRCPVANRVARLANLIVFIL